MNKVYRKLEEVLEVGVSQVSEHLAWVLRTAVFMTCSREACASIIYNKDIPYDMWGVFSGPARGVCLNLERHFENALSVVQDEAAMNTSIRLILLVDLLNTAAHEAWHARKCEETGSFEKGDLDEPGAVSWSEKLQWEIAERVDVNLISFGPLLDSLVGQFFNDLKEDVEEVNCKDWKKIQYHMLVHGLSFYDPDAGIELRSLRTAMEAHVDPAQPWMPEDNPAFSRWVGDVVVGQLNVIEEEKKAAIEAQAIPEPVYVPTAPPQVAPSAPVVNLSYNPLDMEDNYDPFAEEGCTTVAPQTMSQSAPLAPVVPVAAPVSAPINPGMSSDIIQKIAEQVMRKMFSHVFTKCGFNTEGGFNSPEACLTPVDISDIPGATDLFVSQDTYDVMGGFRANEPVNNGFVKGLVTKKGLPSYKFNLNIGGVLHKRTLMPANKDGMKNGALSDWATKVRSGWKIMMVMPEQGSPTAVFKLAPGAYLGQEEFTVWGKK